MRYQSGKSKFAKDIVPILQKCIDDHNIQLYIEPFVGGANIIDKIKCQYRRGFDKSASLIALLKTARDNFDLIPTDCTREMWDKAKIYGKTGVIPDGMSLSEIGAIEFLGSYNCGGFPRGFATPTAERNFYKECYESLKKQAPQLKDIWFCCLDYRSIPFNHDIMVNNREWDLDRIWSAGTTVIYCDPPYAGTKPYSYANEAKFDYDEFWNWVRETSKYNYVFVSEQTAPDDFIPIWQKTTNRTNCTNNNFKATEKLFVHKDLQF